MDWWQWGWEDYPEAIEQLCWSPADLAISDGFTFGWGDRDLLHRMFRFAPRQCCRAGSRSRDEDSLCHPRPLDSSEALQFHRVPANRSGDPHGRRRRLLTRNRRPGPPRISHGGPSFVTHWARPASQPLPRLIPLHGSCQPPDPSIGPPTRRELLFTLQTWV